MSVIIKGIDMPKRCGVCKFGSAFDCMITGEFIDDYSTRSTTCPLVELPKQHGRLIDADELKRKLPEATMIGTDDIEWIIDNGVNTIVEAEEEK